MSRSPFAAFLLVLAMPAASLFAGEIEVPDLETRIVNSGSVIPAAAVPEVPPPAVVPIPAETKLAPAVVSAPVAVPPPTASAAPAESPVPAADSTAASPKKIAGHAAFGAGSESYLYSDVMFERAADAAPGFSLAFTGDSSDGYSPTGAGTGFFDRNMALSAGVSGLISSGNWFVRGAVGEAADGFQSLAVDYASLTRRNVSWSGGIASVPFGASAFTVSSGLDGSLFSAWGDRSLSSPPTVAINPYSGYNLFPRAALGWSAGSFTAGLSLAGGYETAAGSGELLDGSAGLDLGYRLGDFNLSGSVAASGDSSDGFLAPFSLAVSYAKDSSFLRIFRLSGGLARDRSSPWALANDAAFTLLEGHAIYAADWNVSGGFVLAPMDALSVSGSAEYRQTAFDRGVLVVTDEASATTAYRYRIARVDRQSLVTKAGASWSVGSFVLAADYAGEWLDRLYRTTLHTLDLSAKVSGAGALLWDAKASASVPLDSSELPVVGLSASVHPSKDLSLSVSLDDGLPPLFGVTRKVNSLYAGRSGIIALRARVDL
jgi:hypothetical protein